MKNHASDRLSPVRLCILQKATAPARVDCIKADNKSRHNSTITKYGTLEQVAVVLAFDVFLQRLLISRK